MSDDMERMVILGVLLVFLVILISGLSVMETSINDLSVMETSINDLSVQLKEYQDSVNVLIAENIRLNETQMELSKSIVNAMGVKPEPMMFAVCRELQEVKK